MNLYCMNWSNYTQFEKKLCYIFLLLMFILTIIACAYEVYKNKKKEIEKFFIRAIIISEI